MVATTATCRRLYEYILALVRKKTSIPYDEEIEMHIKVAGVQLYCNSLVFSFASPNDFHIIHVNNRKFDSSIKNNTNDKIDSVINIKFHNNWYGDNKVNSIINFAQL